MTSRIRFSTYVTSVGFRLELTKAQLRLFAAVALQTTKRMTFAGAQATTEANLIRKGLLEREPETSRLVLTKEGQLLVPLLRRAGLIQAEMIQTGNILTNLQESLAYDN